MNLGLTNSPKKLLRAMSAAFFSAAATSAVIWRASARALKRFSHIYYYAYQENMRTAITVTTINQRKNSSSPRR
jgi:hypothetical protein